MDRAGRSVIAKLLAPVDQREHLQECGRRLELTVRFISLRLPTGELEVLATSLLDEQKYPTEDFMAVYGSRWNQETFYFLMKSRLELENFSARDKIWFHVTLGLRRDTSSEQMLRVLSVLRDILRQRPTVEIGDIPVRFVGIGNYSLDVEVFCLCYDLRLRCIPWRSTGIAA